jgi:hypothetical protein
MMKTLSGTQAQILSTAAQHAAYLAKAPQGLPAAARNAVFRSMLKSGLLEEVSAPAEYHNLAWRQEEDGTAMVLRVIEAGLRAIGEEATSNPAAGAPVSPVAAAKVPVQRSSLRDAAAVLAAWDAAGSGQAGLPLAGDLGEPMERLRGLLARRQPGSQPHVAGAPRSPREGTKQQAVLTLLRRPEGVTVVQVTEATGWAPHTVRGFLAGLKKKGHAVEVLERVRQVGPGKQGAKGSYSVYRIVEAG